MKKVNYKEKLRTLINESGRFITDGMQSVPMGKKYVYYRKIGQLHQYMLGGHTWKEIYFEMLEHLYELNHLKNESIHIDEDDYKDFEINDELVLHINLNNEGYSFDFYKSENYDEEDYDEGFLTGTYIRHDEIGG